MMDGDGKSDTPTVPGKSPNKAAEPAAEAAEGRGVAKGKTLEHNRLRTQGRESVRSGLERIRQAAGRQQQLRFTTLLHHVHDVGRGCSRPTMR